MNRTTQEQGMEQMKYKALRNLYIVTLCFVVVFIITILSLNNYDGYDKDGLYGLIFVTFFAMVTCIALIPLFVKRRKNFNQAMDPKTQFGFWTLDEAFVLETAKEKMANDKARNKGLMIAVTFFFGLFSIIFAFLLEDDERLMFLMMMLVIYAFIAVFAYLAPKIAYHRRYLQARVVYLGENAVLIGKEFHIFNSAFEVYKSASYDPKKGLLRINYRSLSRTGMTPFTAQVPVPKREEAMANAYIQFLNQRHSKSND